MNIAIGTRLVLSKVFVESGKVIHAAPQQISDASALDYMPDRNTLYFQMHRVVEAQTIDPFHDKANEHALAATPVFLVGSAKTKREYGGFSHDWAMMLMEEPDDCLIATHPQAGSYIFRPRVAPQLIGIDARVNMLQALRSLERPESESQFVRAYA